MSEQVIKLSQNAAERIKDIMSKADNTTIGVRVGVQSGGCAGMSYIMEYAKDIKPKVIVGENVSGLLMGEAKNYYYKITIAFENAGYNVSSMLLDSSHYGVPQTRKRVIFIAVRKDVTDAIGLTSLNIAGIFPEKSSEVVTSGNAFSDLEYDEEEIKHLTERFTHGQHYETASKMPLDPKKVLTGCDYHPKGHHFNMKRISRFKAIKFY